MIRDLLNEAYSRGETTDCDFVPYGSTSARMLRRIPPDELTIEPEADQSLPLCVDVNLVPYVLLSYSDGQAVYRLDG